MNYAGIDNMNNYTGYTYDEVMEIYFAQARFYDPVDKRFIQEDPVKDGSNWYAYCGGNPVTHVDPLETEYITEEHIYEFSEHQRKLIKLLSIMPFKIRLSSEKYNDFLQEVKNEIKRLGKQ